MKHLLLILPVVGSALLSLPVAAQTISIMPIGDSITLGVDYTTDSSGGYRDPLYSDLTTAGVSTQFVGATDTSPTAQLTSTGTNITTAMVSTKSRT